MLYETKRLIELLNEIVSDDDIKKSEYLTDGIQMELPKVIQYIIDYAESSLIENGVPNFDQHKHLSNAGFLVLKGESDSYGWLTGVIVTPKGKIVFG